MTPRDPACHPALQEAEADQTSRMNEGMAWLLGGAAIAIAGVVAFTQLKKQKVDRTCILYQCTCPPSPDGSELTLSSPVPP